MQRHHRRVRHAGIGVVVGCMLAATNWAADSPTAVARSPAAMTKVVKDKSLYDTDDRRIIKRSRNNLCHDASSASFEATIHYSAYRSMQDCLDSGGKRAK